MLSTEPGAGHHAVEAGSFLFIFPTFLSAAVKQPPASGSTLRSDIAYLPRAFGHSADTSSPQAGPSMAKPLKLLVGAQGLEPWTR